MTLWGITFNHSKIYFWALVLAAVSLPLSKFTLSISYIILITNWVLEGDYKNKLYQLKNNKSFWAFLILFLVHVFWLFNTTNFDYAFHDLKNKILIVFFPFIIFSSKPLSKIAIRNILLWFSAAVIASSIISTSIFAGIIDYPITNFRGISVFISHIRFGLLINIAIFSLGYIIFSKEYSISYKIKIGLVFPLLWLVAFLFILKSLTAILILIITLIIVLGFVSFKIKYVVSRLFLQLSLITLFLIAASFITHSVSKFYSVEKVEPESLEIFTLSGNPYFHNLSDKQIENGNYVWIYYCKDELEREWNKRSKLNFSDKDKLGQDLSYTAVRYLTSKGFRKDSIGVSKLSDSDIRNIENGIANYIYTNKFSLYPRIYQVLWEIDVYKKGQNPAGNSITQRIVFVETAIKIIKSNFWIGVGTGDVKDEFLNQYQKDSSQLPINRQLRAHNQYITFLLTFGIFGFLIVFIALIYPYFHSKGYRNFLLTTFFLIAMFSMLNEDTLETQTGISFFSYFYTLFLLENEKNKHKQTDDNGKE